MVAGAVLILWAAVNQPYNQNELKQIEPYGSDDVGTVTGGTRQPPLDALLGSLFQHSLGQGQLRQHLEPALAGIGTLVVLALLLRRLGLGHAGASALWLLATQPLMVHYSAYARPYALPVFLMVLLGYAAHGWMQERRLRWLVLSVAAAGALPLTRVPEPNTFLAALAATLTWASYRHRRPWSQTAPLIATAVAAVAFVGYPMYRSLAADGPGFDPSPAGIVRRFPAGVSEVWNRVLPWMGDWFPWWPVTLALIVVTFALPSARDRLLHEWGWVWWPLLAGPLVFIVAYHFMNPDSLTARPYRDRYAYFFLPAFALLIAALAAVTEEARASGRGTRAVRVGVSLLLGVAGVAQLPATAAVVTENVAPDFDQAGRVLAEMLPADAVVVYATPVSLDLWRQDFLPRQVDPSMPLVLDADVIAKDPAQVPDAGPVYVLVLDGECANSVYCDKPTVAWDGAVEGWNQIVRVDRFSVYAPSAALTGRTGVTEAMTDFAAVFGPEYGLIETFAAASVLRASGQEGQARDLVGSALGSLDPDRAQLLRKIAKRSSLLGRG
ncbi:MAG: glycosyltransferase family 39 protein [Nocardioidaceae bacterium]